MRLTGRRAIALLVLIWALLDLAVPGICPDDAPLLSASHAVPLIVPGSSAPDPVRDAGDRDDGCFCSCAHITVSSVFEWNVSLLSARAPVQPPYGMLDGPPHSLYHPPRA